MRPYKAQALFDGKVQLFEQENKLMSSVPIADNDVLDLNVGGSLICTKRSTLTQVGVFPVALDDSLRCSFLSG